MNNLNVAKIQLNGDSYEINDGANLDQLLNKLKIKKNKFTKSMNFAGKTRPARDFVSAGLKEREKGVLKSFDAFRKDLRKALKK